MPNGLRGGPQHVSEGLRAHEELSAIKSSVAALEVRAADTRSASERDAIELRAGVLLQRAKELAATIGELEDLLTLRVRVADATNNEEFGDVLDANIPVLLLPIRLQTRFVPVGDGVELRIRFLPDTIAIHSHEPELTAAEQALGQEYWTASTAVGADDTARLAAWGRLVTEALGAERAAWVAVCTNPAGGPDAALLERLRAWTRAPASSVMPEHFTVRGYFEGEMVFERTTEQLVPPRLDVGFDPGEPGANAADAQTIPGLIDGLPPQLRWLTDFDVAEGRGMALRVPLTVGQAADGFDRLILLGVRTTATAEEGGQLVRELFDAHHYTEGLAIAPRGAPTNNTEEGGAWYVSNPPASQSYATERQGPLFDLDEPNDAVMDGPVLARALGIPAETFAHVRGADGTDQIDAAMMACALWPATWGYYLKEVLADTISTETIAGLRRHFIHFVRGRGPLPPIRTGPNPYGVLPVTSLLGWTREASDADLPQTLLEILWQMRQDWLTMSRHAPRVGATSDTARDLYDVMTMQASSASFARSAVYGEEFTGQSSASMNMWGIDWGELFPQIEPPADEMAKLLRRLGLSDEIRPRLATFLSDAPVPIDGLSLVHDEVGPQPLPGAPNYIAWLATAPVDDIRAERNRPAGAANSLLYRILRHSVLSAYVETAKTILITTQALPVAYRFEPELVAMPGVATPSTYSHLDARFVPPGGQQEVRIGDYLSQLDVDMVRRIRQNAPAWLLEFFELRSCLTRLATVSTERLQLLMTETLDCCSHRLDAWLTSLATRRLQSMRIDRPNGLYVGAYGWVDDLRQRQGPAGGGYVLAPSSSHATAAAILRSGYLSREGDARGTLAVELSSHRVKEAMAMFESIRVGNTLPAVLGYRFERSLHEAPVALGLEQYLPALREAFPIDTGTLTEPNGPTEAIAANLVVNGLALRNRWLEFGPAGRNDVTRRLFDDDKLPLIGSDAGGTLIELLDRLEALHDAMADVALSESVFQAGRGQYERAGAVAAAMAAERQMPEIEVTQTPRTGTTIRHRVVVSLDPVSQNALDGWPNARTPRANAGPEVNQWLAAAIGDPASIGVHVRFLEVVGNATVERREWMRLSTLQVDAADAVTFATSADTAGASELEERIRYWLGEANATRRQIEISFDHPPPWTGAAARPNGERTVADVAELLRTLQRLFGTSRPALPSDLLAPDQAGDKPLVDLDAARLTARARAAVTGLWNAYRTLRPLVTAARQAEAARIGRNEAAAAAGNPPAGGDEAPDPTPLDPIRRAAFSLGWYGVNDAVIPHEAPPGGGQHAAARARWYRAVDRAASALGDAARRLVAILEVATPADLTQAEVDTELAAIDQLAADVGAAIAAVDTAIANGVAESEIEAAERLRDAALDRVLTRCTDILKLVFGKGFAVVPPLVLGLQHPLRAAHTTAGGGALGGVTAAEMERWLFQVSQAHPGLTELELVTTMSAVQGNRGSFDHSASQVPFHPADRWAALDRPGGSFPPGLLCAFFVGGVRFSDANNHRFAGLVAGDWQEVVPNAAEMAAVAFQFDQPASEPPQAVLLAVPQATGNAARWRRSQLMAILDETRNLARIRAIDPPLINEWYGVALPALYFTQNFADEAVSTYFFAEPLLVGEVSFVGAAMADGGGG